MRWVKKVWAICALAWLLSACSPAQLSALETINNTRAARGLSVLTPSPHAMDKAQAWAEHLAAEHNLKHSNVTDGMPDGWRRLGENVGSGPDVGAIFAALLLSPSHRANLVDPRWNWAGTGVASASDGTVYVVQVFALY